MTKEVPAPRLDPMAAWRDWFVQSERDWSEALTRLMKDDATAKAVGQEINKALYAQQMLKQGMAGPMAMMNVATQDQLATLAERLGGIEDAVARIEVSLAQLCAPLATETRPARSRVAPSSTTEDDAPGMKPLGSRTRKSRA